MTTSTDGVEVWLVERTYSDDEQNLVVLTYATPDGERYFRKERALTTPTTRSETRDCSAVPQPYRVKRLRRVRTV